MGGGNGAKAAQKRERNAKAAGGSAKSQLKANEKAMTIQCDTCKATFLSTTRENALAEHATNKHTRRLPSASPGFVSQAK